MAGDQLGLSEMKLARCMIRISLAGIVLLSCLHGAVNAAADDYDYDGDAVGDNQEAASLLTELVYSRLSNLTKIFSKDVIKKLNFCIKDV